MTLLNAQTSFVFLDSRSFHRERQRERGGGGGRERDREREREGEQDILEL